VTLLNLADTRHRNGRRGRGDGESEAALDGAGSTLDVADAPSPIAESQPAVRKRRIKLTGRSRPLCGVSGERRRRGIGPQSMNLTPIVLP
jgi:hypothetical protein